RDGSVAARERAETARDQAEIYSAGTIELQDSAVAGLIGTAGSQSEEVLSLKVDDGIARKGGERSSSGFVTLAGTVPGSIPVAKPAGDARAGVWEYTHNSETGYLWHLLAGANMSHQAALIATGVDNDGIGVLIPNKKL